VHVRWLRRIVITVAALGILLAGTALVGGQMGLFSGKRPADIGLQGGKLRGGDWRPNWASSQVAASDAKHFIEPYKFQGAADAAWARLEKAIGAVPGATVATRQPGYLHAEFATKVMGFVDDAEFALDAAAGVIHVRSGARLGMRDFGVNRARLEALRTAFAAS